MKKHDVLVVGELNVDIILNDIDGFPQIGKEILADKMTVTLGSSSAILASNLAVLGPKTAFMGKIGQDNFGDLAIETLDTKQVNTENIISGREFTTGATIVLSYETDRANVTFPGAMDLMDAEEVTDQILSESKHLHVSSIFMQKSLKSGLIDLFVRAKRLGLTTSIDPQWDPKEEWDIDLKSLLPYVDVLLPNEKEFMLLTKTESITEGIESVRNYSNILVIKEGAKGAHLWNKTHQTHNPAFLNKNICDAIGAGDSFNAGFLSKFLTKDSLENCVTFGNLMGAINTTCYGGTTAFTSLEAVKKSAKSKFNYTF